MVSKPLNHLQIKALRPTGSRQTKSCGDGLYLIVEPIHKAKNGKSFIGRMRFPPTKDGKQVDTRIGKFGDGVNEWSCAYRSLQFDTETTPFPSLS